ncbi:MAG: tryptophan synthase subunit alpha [Pseudomonadota bacterium]|jgi:tryptophan synthase alpha chain
MSRIAQRFAELKPNNRKALIPYITAGDPHPSLTVPLMHAMVAVGADLIELGIPFSDPMADGPTIQLACERALKHNTSLGDVLDMVKSFREHDQSTPVILMGYLNPIEVMGYGTFAARAEASGVDGVLTVDLPPEEGNETVSLFKKHQLDTIYLVSPTTKPERIQKIAALGSGFLYYVSLKGVTGANTLDIEAVKARLSLIRDYSNLPLGVGFGIKDAATAALVAPVADAVIVGSAVIKLVEANPDDHGRIVQDIANLIAAMRDAMDQAVRK